MKNLGLSSLCSIKKNLVGIQGRSLKIGDKKSVKYITVMINDDAPKIYGLDDVELDGPVYVTEGPFDSTFIHNSIAMCGADGDVGKWGISNPIWIYDNEPRNREIVSRIERTISKGDSVVIWNPESIDDKDINDMVNVWTRCPVCDKIKYILWFRSKT